MSVYNTTLSDCDYVFPFNSVSGDDNAFSNNASANCCTNMYTDVGSSLDHNFATFQYTHYSTCDYDQDLDRVNNLYRFLQVLFWLVLSIPASCASSVLSIVLRLCACV